MQDSDTKRQGGSTTNEYLFCTTQQNESVTFIRKGCVTTIIFLYILRVVDTNMSLQYKKVDDNSIMGLQLNGQT